MTVRESRSLPWWVVAVVTLSACGAQSATAPTVTVTTVTSRHPGHDALAAALPAAAQLAWLPSGVQSADDSDLTDRLSVSDCGGQATRVPSRESSATNRGFDVAGQRLAEVTYYDVETIEGAQQFIAALHTLLGCPVPVNTALTVALINVDDLATTKCDEAVLVRVHQPVSETIDGWCRVGNLLAWIRLYPTGPDTGTGVAVPGDTGLVPAPGENLTPPTDANAKQILAVVGEHLRVASDVAN